MSKGQYRSSGAVSRLKEFVKGSGDMLARASDAVESVEKESDRSLVVILASHMESALQRSLRTQFREITDREAKEALKLFEPEGLLATFHQKINMAYLLDIIDEPCRKRLHVLRELRNACAHSAPNLSFETPAVLDVVREFFSGAFCELEREDRATVRVTLTMEVYSLMHLVITQDPEKTLEFARARTWDPRHNPH